MRNYVSVTFFFVAAMIFVSCASIAPEFSPQVGKEKIDTAKKKEDAKQAYWDEREKMYKEGTYDNVPPAPVKEYSGLLSNQSRYSSVRFEFDGPAGLSKTVTKSQVVQVKLPAGYYAVKLYRFGSSRPYKKDRLHINSKGGEHKVEGRVCDWYVIAP